MLHTNNVTFSYTNNRTFFFPDINCQSGETMLLLGNSGTGKTTLLHLIGGLLQPSSGNIKINYTDITRLSATALDRFRGKNIGIVFQQSHFVQALSVIENLLLAQQLAGCKKDEQLIRQYLTQLQILDKLNSKTNQLSIGEQQRVAIVRAVIQQPKLILADEPTSALDDVNCQEVATLLSQQANQIGAALVIVTHDARLKNKYANHLYINQLV
ncbi:MAG: ATP-binding cassette domain-containing protein [Saprospiraceae bacterium]|nr:ATP-binding cassette domain-containing protein [Saprospiraceae bacterium]